MIPIHFEYYRPQTVRQAVETYIRLLQEKKKPLYYGGGSEIISMSRAGDIHPGAVIDIKEIPECMVFEEQNERLVIGAAVTLRQIRDSRMFPLLGTVSKHIADHTNQCRITLGGNLCGNIIYREMSSPLLLSDAQVLFFGPDGVRRALFTDAFQLRMLMNPGELLMQIHISKQYLKSPYRYIKKTANEKIDYPLMSIAALYDQKSWRVAFSGLCASPFRSLKIEEILNQRHLSPLQRAEMVSELVPGQALSDYRGSSQYRLFMLKNTLADMMEEWEHV